MSTTTQTDTWSELDHAARDIYQTRRWAEVDQAMQDGEPTALSGHLPDGEIWVPTMRRPVGPSHVLFSPYGYPGIVRSDDRPVEAEPLAASLVDRVRSAHACALLVRLHPVLDAELPDLDLPHAATVTHGPTVSMDLRSGLDAAWSAMRSRTRGYIRRAERDGFVTRINEWDEDFEGFRRAYDESMDRNDASATYRLSDEYWARLRGFGPDHVMLVTVRDPSGPVAAGGIVTRFGRMGSYHLGGTRSWALDHHLLELVLWRAAEALSPSVDLLHLGGGVGSRRDGLFQLKHGLGRLEHSYRTLRLIADRAEYEALAGVRASRFPPIAA